MPSVSGGRTLLRINRTSEAYLRGLGKSTSPEMRAAAQVLKKKIQKQFGPKTREVSRPGQPPKTKSGELKRSVKDGPIGDVRRVAVLSFTASILATGYDAKITRKAGRRQRNRQTGQLEGKRNARALLAQAEARRLEARPFMDPALAEAEGPMGDVLVSAMQSRMPSTTL